MALQFVPGIISNLHKYLQGLWILWFWGSGRRFGSPKRKNMTEQTIQSLREVFSIQRFNLEKQRFKNFTYEWEKGNFKRLMITTSQLASHLNIPTFVPHPAHLFNKSLLRSQRAHSWWSKGRKSPPSGVHSLVQGCNLLSARLLPEPLNYVIWVLLSFRNAGMIPWVHWSFLRWVTMYVIPKFQKPMSNTVTSSSILNVLCDFSIFLWVKC